MGHIKMYYHELSQKIIFFGVGNIPFFPNHLENNSEKFSHLYRNCSQLQYSIMYVPSVIYTSEFRTALTVLFLVIEINNKKGGLLWLDVHSANIFMHTVLMYPPCLSYYQNDKSKLKKPEVLTTQTPKPDTGTDQTCCMYPWLFLLNSYKVTITSRFGVSNVKDRQWTRSLCLY